MKSLKKSKPAKNELSEDKKAAIEKSAMHARSQKNPARSLCPFKTGSAASAYWLSVYDNGLPAEEKPTEPETAETEESTWHEE